MPTTTTIYAHNASGHRGMGYYSAPDWATAHNASTGGVLTTDGLTGDVPVYIAGPTITYAYAIKRAYLVFDTSSIPDDVTISSAILRVRTTYVGNMGASMHVGLVQATPASPTSLVTEDYDQFGTTVAQEQAIFISNATYDFSLASYLSWVNKTGYTQLGLRSYTHDILDSSPSFANGMRIDLAVPDNATTSYRPQLIVTYWGTDRYWVGGQGSLSETQHWSDTSGGTGGAPVPTSANPVYFDANSGFGANQVWNINVTMLCASMDWTGVTNSPTIVGTVPYDLGVTGTLTLAAGMTCSFSGYIYAGGLINNGVALAGTLASGGTFGLSENLTVGTLYIYGGTFSTNNFNITCGTFSSSLTTARTINLGSSTITCTSDWNCYTSNNLTLNAGTSTINLTGVNTYFHGGAKTYATVNLQNSLTMTSNNTFGTLGLTAGKTYIFSSGSTQIFTTLTATGSAGNLITLRANTAGSTFAFSKASGTVTCDFIDVKDCVAGGGATFNPGDNSIDSGNNTGWTQPWTGGGNAYSSNDSYATHTSPTGKLYVQLSKDGGTTWQTALLKTYTGAEGAQTYGDGATEKWGTTFTGADMDDASFKLRIIANSADSFNWHVYGGFAFDALIAQTCILTGVEVSVEGKWDGTTLSVDHVKVQGHSGTSTFPVTEGVLAYSTDKDAIVGYDGNNWFAATPEHGWIGNPGTFTYASTTTINVSTGAATRYSVGDKLRFQNNSSGTWLYVYVVGIADTLLTVTGTTVPNATLTTPFYSKIESPQGFPHWFSWIPTTTSGTGSPTTITLTSARFIVKGRACTCIVETIDTNPGTAGGNRYLTMPIASAHNYFYGFGHEYAISGWDAQVRGYDESHIVVLHAGGSSWNLPTAMKWGFGWTYEI